MSEITRGEIARVGVDLAKRVIQVHAVDAAGRVLAAKALARDKFMDWCAQLPGLFTAPRPRRIEGRDLG